MIKKVFYACLFCAVALGGTAVYAQIEDVRWDPASSTVSFSGNVTGEAATLIAYDAGVEPEIADGSLADGSVGGVIFHIAELPACGAFQYSFAINPPAGAVELVLALRGGEEEETARVCCYGEEYRRTLVEQIGSADPGGTGALLENPINVEILGIDTVFTPYCGAMDGVYLAISELKLSGTIEEQLKSVRDTYLCETFFTAVNSAAAGEACELLELVNARPLAEKLLFDETKIAYFYSRAENQKKEIVMQLSPAKDLESWRSGFYTAIALKNVSFLTYGYMEELLSAFADDLVLRNYPISSQSASGKVYRGIAGNRYKTAQALDDAIYELSRPKETTGGGGGGGSGSGGFSGNTGISVDTEISTYVPSENPPEALESAFPDLQNHAWAVPAISALKEKGVLSGYEDGMFRPDGQVTRAEAVKMLVTAFDMNLSSDSVFSDAGEAHWAYPYLQRSGGLVQGDEEGRFRPDESIRREDLAVLLCRALGRENEISENATPFLDDSAISGYAKAAVYLLKEMRIIQGSDGSFLPGSGATRAETAAMIYRAMTTKER